MAKKPRLSLTKAQIQAGIGAELLTLCQSITDDGRLAKQEIVELRAWLTANRGSDLPAVEFLATTVERIIADGRVTSDELKGLYKAVETVLPPEARKRAVAARKDVEAEAKAKERAQREAQKQQERAEREAQRELDRAERERTRPLMSLNFMVAGVHAEGRPDVIRQYVEEDDTVYLARDRGNRFSRNAVEVRLRNGLQIGFVPEVDAVDAAPLLDQGYPHAAHITKVLTGGRVPIPVVQAYIYRAESGTEFGVFPNDVPSKQLAAPEFGDFQDGSPAQRQAGGCLTLLLIGVLGLLGAFVVGCG